MDDKQYEINSLLELAEKNFLSGNYAQARLALHSLINFIPTHSRANELLAYIAAHENSSELFCRLLSTACIDPECSIEALYHLGSYYLSKGDHIQSIGYLERALQKKEGIFEVLHDLGSAYALHGMKREAQECYLKASKINNNSPELFFNLGRLSDDFKNFEEALICYNKAIQLNPNYVDAWSNKGVALYELQRYQEALICYDRAIQLNPNYVDAWSNKGVALCDINRHQEALICYDRAIQLNPNYVDAWSNRGFAYSKLKIYDEAILSFQKAIELKSQRDFLPGFLMHARMHLCDWDSYQTNVQALSNSIISRQKVSYPFALISLSESEEVNTHAAKILVNEKYPEVVGRNLYLENSRESQKICLGYFSADFHNHATAHLMAELFELHDQSRFELIAFSFGPRQDSQMRKRLINAFDKFVDVMDMDDAEIAALSRNLGVDLAIDL